MNKEEFLLDMLDYYTVDPEGRRCRDENNCYYSPETVHKPTSEGCAIGRKLDRQVANNIDGKYHNAMGITYILDERFEGIPDYMYVLGNDFLTMCQDLHDRNEHWDFTNMFLSKEGKDGVAHIIRCHGLDKSKFEKYL